MKSRYIRDKGSNVPARDLSHTTCNATRGPWPRQPEPNMAAVPVAHHRTALHSKVYAAISSTGDLANLPAVNRAMSRHHPGHFPRGCPGRPWTLRPEWALQSMACCVLPVLRWPAGPRA